MMTSIYAEKDGRRRILAAKGHATEKDGGGGPEEGGKVCAGISAILYALGGYLQNAAGEPGRRVEVFACRLDSGDAYIDAAVDQAGEGAFDTAVIGLTQIAAGYPRRVKMELQF